MPLMALDAAISAGWMQSKEVCRPVPLKHAAPVHLDFRAFKPGLSQSQEGIFRLRLPVLQLCSAHEYLAELPVRTGVNKLNTVAMGSNLCTHVSKAPNEELQPAVRR